MLTILVRRSAAAAAGELKLRKFIYSRNELVRVSSDGVYSEVSEPAQERPISLH